MAVLQLLLALWAIVYFCVCAVAIVRSLRERSRRPRTSLNEARILLVRPCTGDEAHLVSALRSTAFARNLGDTRISFTVAETSDPAWPIVQRVAQELRNKGVNATAVVCPTAAPNRKVGQLACATRGAREDIVVCVDADVDLTDFDLAALVAPLLNAEQNPRERCAASWAPPVEVAPPTTWGDRMSASVLGASLHAFALLGQLDRNGLVGKVFAVRRDALDDVGGFAPLGQVLGEDMALAERLRSRGWTTMMLPRTARAIATGRSIGSIIGRYTRWLWVIRAQRPWLLLSYPMLLAAAPLLLASGFTLSLFAPQTALAIVTLTLSARVTVAWTASRSMPHRWSLGPLRAILGDIVLLTAFAKVLGSAKVRWRGHDLCLSDGRLSDVSTTTDLQAELAGVHRVG